MYYLIAVFNVIALYLAIHNNRGTWWFAILGTTLASIMFYDDMLFTSFAFNVYSTLCSIVALFTWKKSSSENVMDLDTPDYIGPATPILAVIFVFLNICVFNTSYPLFDALGSTFAMIATYLLVKKCLSAYLYWIACDTTYLVLGFYTNDTKYLIIYTVMLIMSIYGFFRNYNRILREPA